MIRSGEAEQVRRYYDRHTPAFVLFGQRASDGAIHRAIWGPGVARRRQAFRYVEDRLVELIRQLPPRFDASRVVDLGCGVGASLCYLAEALPLSGTGVTLSPVQVRLAERRIREAGLSERIRCIEADYCDLPVDVGTADLAYAIESFVHGPSPARFFAQCARVVRPGGVLVICDDFRRSANDAVATRTIERFCKGWHVNTLLEPADLHSLARAAGFEHESTVDLSPYLEIRRMRDRVGQLLFRLFGSIQPIARRFDYLSGGIALQMCLERGWIGYDLTRFRRID
jgi:SAM-dependent methyltransferase